MIQLYFASLLVFLCMSQIPPFWGGNPRYTVRVKMLYDSPKIVWNFTYYYDWNFKVEKYEHDAPQANQICVLPDTSFSKQGKSCTVTAAYDGWIYVEFPSEDFCCKCTKSFGAIRYDWLQSDSNYIGTETINGMAVTHWTKMGQYLNHYYSTVDKGYPIRFFELKNGNPKSWDFDLQTYNTGPIDPDKFKPPCSNQCGGTCNLLSDIDIRNSI